MSVRQVAEEMKTNRGNIITLYSSFPEKIENLGNYIKTKKNAKRAGKLLREMKRLNTEIPSIVSFTDPFELNAKKFLNYSKKIESTKEKIIELDKKYHTLFGKEYTVLTKVSDEDRFIDIVKGGTTLQADIAKAMGRKKTDIKEIAKRLEKRGLISEGRYSEDKRKKAYVMKDTQGPQKEITFNYEDLLGKIENDKHYNTLLMMGGRGIRVLKSSKNTSDPVTLSEETGLPAWKVNSIMHRLKENGIIINGHISTYGSEVLKNYQNLDIQNEIALLLCGGKKTIPGLCKITGKSTKEIMEGLDSMKNFVHVEGNGYSVLPHFVGRLDNIRNETRRMSLRKVKNEERSIVKKIILSPDNFGSSNEKLNFWQRAIWTAYENVAKQCTGEEMQEPNKALSKVMESKEKNERLVDGFYSSIKHLREKYDPAFGGRPRF